MNEGSCSGAWGVGIYLHFFSIWILAVRVAATFSVMLVILWRIVSLIFFIVSCRSISYMAVPFNLYSLGYFLKRFIEHYPRLNCIYYPLTQLLKWSISIWLRSFLLLFAFPLISHRSLLRPGVLPFPSRSAWAEQPFKGKFWDLKKNPSSLSEPSLRQQFDPTKFYLVSALWSDWVRICLSPLFFGLNLLGESFWSLMGPPSSGSCQFQPISC